MSRTKSTGLIKAAKRPKSDAGRAGWRPKVDMAASMQINGARPSLSTSGGVPLRAFLGAPEPPSAEVATMPPDLCGLLTKTGAVCLQDLGHLGRCETPAVEAEAREIAAPVEAPDPKRRMTQPGLFDSLGVKV